MVNALDTASPIATYHTTTQQLLIACATPGYTVRIGYVTLGDPTQGLPSVTISITNQRIDVQLGADWTPAQLDMVINIVSIYMYQKSWVNLTDDEKRGMCQWDT